MPVQPRNLEQKTSVKCTTAIVTSILNNVKLYFRMHAYGTGIGRSAVFFKSISVFRKFDSQFQNVVICFPVKKKEMPNRTRLYEIKYEERVKYILNFLIVIVSATLASGVTEALSSLKYVTR